jgi:hypothetical protein
MNKSDLIKELKELQEAYDGLWVTKERYKKLWLHSEECIVALHGDLKQLLEGIKE